MFKKIYKSILIILLISLCIGFVNAQEEPQAEKIWTDNLGKVVNETEYEQTVNNEQSGLISILSQYIKLFLTLLSIVFVLLIIYAGFLWMSAGGNDDQVAKSKTIIKNSLIGLIIALSAYATAYYIVEKSVRNTQEEHKNSSGWYIRGMND
ncbi:MAG: pilin [bacterium]